MMNSQKDPLALPVIKQEFDDVLISSVEGWSPLTGNKATNSSRTISTSTTQSGENLFSPTATTSNDSTTTTTTTTPLPKLFLNTYPSVSSVNKIPKIEHQGLVKKLEINNKRPFVSIRNKFVPNDSIIQNNKTNLLFNLELQLKQTQKQLQELTVESRNANKILEKKYDELKLEYCEFKTNANIKLNKLYDEINQLKNHHQTRIDQFNAQDTPNQSQLNSIHQQNVDTTIDNLLTTPPVNSTVQIKQEIIDEESTCSLASLTDQNVTEMQHIKQEFSDDDSLTNKSEQFTVDDISTSTNKSSDVNIDEVMVHENELVDGDKDNLDQDLDDDDISNTTDDNNHFVVESNGPSTSARRQSNRIASKSPTRSSPQNLPKRKQSQPNRTAKRSKKTIEDDDGGVDEKVNQNDDKIKLNYLDCTEPNCKAKLNSLKHFYDHLSSAHELLPFRCFEQNCNLRFDKSHIGTHHKLHHTNPNSKFVCPVCRKEFTSQQRTYIHWNQHHLSGKFRCNLNECNLVFDTRAKIDSHQNYKHCPEQFVCQHDGCSLTFLKKAQFDQHKLVHLNNKPFHCKWPQCSHRANRRAGLIIHIRMQHFGLPATMKEQREKNIVEERDPNDYVRVVEHEIVE